MTIHRRGTRPRLLLALLLAALVAGAIPVRPPAASRSEKAPGTSAWRAAPVRLMAARPDLELRGFPPLPAFAPDPLPPPPLARADEGRLSPLAPAALPGPRSPLPRAPPRA